MDDPDQTNLFRGIILAVLFVAMMICAWDRGHISGLLEAHADCMAIISKG